MVKGNPTLNQMYLSLHSFQPILVQPSPIVWLSQTFSNYPTSVAPYPIHQSTRNKSIKPRNMPIQAQDQEIPLQLSKISPTTLSYTAPTIMCCPLSNLILFPDFFLLPSWPFLTSPNYPSTISSPTPICIDSVTIPVLPYALTMKWGSALFEWWNQTLTNKHQCYLIRKQPDLQLY